MELHPKTIATLAGMFIVATLSCVARQSRSAVYDNSPVLSGPPSDSRSQSSEVSTPSAADEYYAAPSHSSHKAYTQPVRLETAQASTPTFEVVLPQETELTGTQQIVEPQSQPDEAVIASSVATYDDFITPVTDESVAVTSESAPSFILPAESETNVALSEKLDLYINNVNQAQGLGLDFVTDLAVETQHGVVMNVDTTFVTSEVDGPVEGPANTVQFVTNLNNDVVLSIQENSAPAAVAQLQQQVNSQIQDQLQARLDVVQQAATVELQPALPPDIQE